jgi:phosphoadenosine phosphosulfate reductase
MKLQFPDKLLPVFFARARQKKVDVEAYLADLLSQLSAKISKEPGFQIGIADKIELSKWVILQALKQFGEDKTAVAWTGGKDSTLILWMVREVAAKNHLKMPHCMFINEGHVFEEITEFVESLSKKWNLEISEVHNHNVSSQVKKIGDPVTVAKLDEINRREVKRLGYNKPTFPFEPESYVGNHLMKTVAMNRFLADTKYEAVITGIRWDEQEARAHESYFSPRGDQYTPKHMRVHPILHFTEKEIWETIIKFKVPFCKLYKEGYRSLGAKGTTKKAGDKPAWEQDFEKVPERAGRRQDKEGIMENLRKLGYM